MQEALKSRLAAANSLASASAAWSMATWGQHFDGVCKGSWSDQPPAGLRHTLLGGTETYQRRTPSYHELYELEGKLWVKYDNHGCLVYSREDGMTEQQGHVHGWPGAELSLCPCFVPHAYVAFTAASGCWLTHGSFSVFKLAMLMWQIQKSFAWLGFSKPLAPSCTTASFTRYSPRTSNTTMDQPAQSPTRTRGSCTAFAVMHVDSGVVCLAAHAVCTVWCIVPSCGERKPCMKVA